MPIVCLIYCKIWWGTGQVNGNAFGTQQYNSHVCQGSLFLPDYVLMPTKTHTHIKYVIPYQNNCNMSITLVVLLENKTFFWG